MDGLLGLFVVYIIPTIKWSACAHSNILEGAGKKKHCTTDILDKSIFYSRHSASLWPNPRTEAGVTKMAALWQRLLEQNGCSALVKAGIT